MPQVAGKQRQSRRLSREEAVEYTPYSVLLPRLENVSRQGRCVDLSEDEQGVGFVTCHPLFTGRRLRVTIGSVARTGLVRWVGTVAEGYRVGVSFSPVPAGSSRG